MKQYNVFCAPAKKCALKTGCKTLLAAIIADNLLYAAANTIHSQQQTIHSTQQQLLFTQSSRQSLLSSSEGYKLKAADNLFLAAAKTTISKQQTISS